MLVWRFSRVIGCTMLDRRWYRFVANSIPRPSDSISRWPLTANSVPMPTKKTGIPVSWQTMIPDSSETEIAADHHLQAAPRAHLDLGVLGTPHRRPYVGRQVGQRLLVERGRDLDEVLVRLVVVPPHPGVSVAVVVICSSMSGRGQVGSRDE